MRARLLMVTVISTVLVLAWYAGAAQKRKCFCFDWVHGREWGRECHPSLDSCQAASKGWGKSGDRTPCKASMEEDCIKWGCTSPGGQCYRYGCPPDGPDGGESRDAGTSKRRAAPPAQAPKP